MRTNGGKRPDEILAEIDHTRHEMDRTLSAIEHRLTPGQLMDHGIDYLRHSGANEFVQNLGGTAKQNPLPVALTTIGLAWLMALGRQPAQQNDGSSMSSSGLRETLSSAKERVGGTMSSMRESGAQLGESAREQWQRARGGIDYLVNEQPLVLGAIGLALGAVLGAAAPRTRFEERTVGDAARKVTEKAKEVAETTMGQTKPQVPKPQVPPQAPRQHPGPTASGPDKKGGW
jgi:ElaB/YqjD/DUF883 family membrane-anchored ribosome-binding protein